jgi:Fe-S oxidoreductase
MFEAIDRHPDQDSARMTEAEQDQVVDECFNCKLCYVNCPYVPGQSEWELDFPRLMLRAKQVQHREGHKSIRRRLTDRALAQTDRAGSIGTALAPLLNRVVDATGEVPRKVVQAATGIQAERVLPPYARERFSTWFRKRPDKWFGSSRQGSAIVFPTCLVEYQDTAVGQDLVEVYEHNRISCTLPPGQQCCGAPMLHQGDVEGFERLGRKNVKVLADAIRAGRAEGEDPVVVVPQPTCSYVLKHDYLDYLGGTDAKLVAERTRDASEYLVDIHKGKGTELETDFRGEVPEAVTYHAPCHLRAQNIGLRSRDLIELTGAEVTVVAECSGIDGTWGLREENYDLARGVARKMKQGIEKAANPVVAGDCNLANGGIVLETGITPVHPLQLLARAYGIEPEIGRTTP